MSPIRSPFNLSFRYIFFELLPVYLMGLVVFLIIILMTKIFDITDFFFGHGASIETILQFIFYTTTGILPVLLSMSLFFAILICYGRLSADSEIVALKSLGFSTLKLSFPTWILAIIIYIISLQSSFFLAPWGQFKMDQLTNKLLQSKPATKIREGVFSELSDYVVFANKVEDKGRSLTNLFISVEKDNKSAHTIIAKKGELITQQSANGSTSVIFKLYKGSIHKAEKGIYSKVDFEANEINIHDPLKIKKRHKSPQSYNYNELIETLNSPITTNNPMRLLAFSIEFHKRWALAFTCLIFTFLGLGLGIITNKRNTRANGFIICVGLIITYWIMYAACESLTKGGTLPVIPGIWLTNFIFLTIGIWRLYPVYRR